jgi:hypothetical protein
MAQAVAVATGMEVVEDVGLPATAVVVRLGVAVELLVAVAGIVAVGEGAVSST